MGGVQKKVGNHCCTSYQLDREVADGSYHDAVVDPPPDMETNEPRAPKRARDNPIGRTVDDCPPLKRIRPADLIALVTALVNRQHEHAAAVFGCHHHSGHYGR